MFVFALEITLESETPIGRDGLDDVIETMVDELDTLDCEPSISTTGTGQEVTMLVEVIVDKNDEMEAWECGFATIRSALHAAGVFTGGMIVPTHPTPSVRRLQDA